MKVVSIGSDRKVFDEGSEVRKRAAAYAARLGELHVVVFALAQHGCREVHDGLLHLYPTNSWSRSLCIFDAIKVARRLPGEVVTTQDPFEAGLAGFLARRGRPLHVQLHTDPFAPSFKKSLINRVRLLLARVVLPRAARVRTVSHAVAEKLRGTYPKLPISTLPIFVDVEKYRGLEGRPHPRFKTALLWVGRFEKEKNPELAIRALMQVQEAFPDTGLILLGLGQLEQELRALAQKLGVDDRVEFAGWRDPAEFLGASNLLLVTSDYEGYGRQIIEALAAGVPVLSTDVGVAREAGAIITNKKEFVSALIYWLDNGPHTAELKNYPYSSFAEYVEQYCADIQAAVL